MTYVSGVHALCSRGAERTEIGATPPVAALLFAPNTDEVLNEMLSLNSDVKIAEMEIFAALAGKMPGDKLWIWYVSVWKEYKAKWNEFFARNKGFWSRFMSTKGIYNKTRIYRDELIAHRKTVATLGMRFQSPEPSAIADTSLLPSSASMNTFLRAVLYILIGVGALMILNMLVNLFRR
jgi:hypothetical protein